MTVDDVRKEVECIRSIAWDDERAHSTEDSLYRSVLIAIAQGKCANPSLLAAAALESREH
jgi:hypothetical protein